MLGRVVQPLAVLGAEALLVGSALAGPVAYRADMENRLLLTSIYGPVQE